MSNSIKQIATLNKKIIDTFSLPYEIGQPILCGDNNINHMKKEHPEDYIKYGNHITDIISNPDYMAKHPKKNSIEFIKKFYTNKEKTDYVLVAVRASGKGTLFARTLFIMNPEKIDKYNNKNALIPY